jgi:hypothetical protein
MPGEGSQAPNPNWARISGGKSPCTRSPTEEPVRNRLAIWPNPTRAASASPAAAGLPGA